MRARILERWDMDIEPDGDGGYQDWAIRSPAGISQSITAGWHAYRSLVPRMFDSAHEYFAGIGAQSLIIEELFCPFAHTAQDYSAGAARHLLHLLAERGVGVRQADSYAAPIVDAELVALDFGDLTVWKVHKPGQHRDLIDRVFEKEPKAVVLTDIAGPRLHLHRSRYDTVLGDGACSSYQSYLTAFTAYLQGRYGYTLTGGYYHKAAAKLAFVPGYETNAEVLPVPAQPVGLEVI